MKMLDEIRAEIERGVDTETVISELTVFIAAHPQEDEALTLRGMRYWSMGKRSLAINDYLAAIRLNPKSRAGQLMKASYEILNYYNKDLLNP